MSKYLYTGPDSAVSFKSGERIRLVNGKLVELPDNTFTRTLLEKGHLARADAKTATTEKAPKSKRGGTMRPPPASPAAPPAPTGGDAPKSRKARN